MSPEAESLTLQLLRDMRAEIGDVRSEIKDLRQQMATKHDVAHLRFAMNLLRGGVASDLAVMRKELGEQIIECIALLSIPTRRRSATGS